MSRSREHGPGPDADDANGSKRLWLGPAIVVAVLLAIAAAWHFGGIRERVDFERLAEAIEPYRTSWLAFPATLLIFVVAELLVFPVLVLVFACGIVFGPWLGAVHALLGALVSALIPFWIGRRLGADAVTRRGGRLVQRIQKTLERRGVIAVFLVRKIPAPYTLVNVVCGASSVTLRDFLLGTLLGMGTGVVLITVLGGQLFGFVSESRPWHWVAGIGLLFVPLLLALLMQHVVNRRVAQSDEH